MSKFVSGGTLDKLNERDDAWLKAEQELEDRRKQREIEKAAHDGKTLYEALQANKAAKEDAFQESIKLKNQFRGLDDDEADFLDSQAEAVRLKEEAVKRETREQLDQFRQKQEAAGRTFTDPALAGNESEERALIDVETNWTTAKKRKRVKEKAILKGAKMRKTSSNDTMDDSKATDSAVPITKYGSPDDTTTTSNAPKTIINPPKKQGLSLVSYGSDAESD